MKGYAFQCDQCKKIVLSDDAYPTQFPQSPDGWLHVTQRVWLEDDKSKRSRDTPSRYDEWGFCSPPCLADWIAPHAAIARARA